MESAYERRDRLAAIVSRFAGRRIAVLGDFVSDEFVYGDIERVSREAPVLILSHRATEIVPGGGANSVANLHVLGAFPVPVGVVGDDPSGHGLLGRFRAWDLPTAGIVVARDYATPAKSRILAGGVHTRRQQVVRVDRGAAHGDLPAGLGRRLAGALGRAIRSAEALLVADYGYGAATPAIAARAIARLAERGVPVTVDSRSRVAQYRGVTACTPNQEELEQALGGGPVPDPALAAAGRRLVRRTANRAVLVTRGAKGMVLFSRRAEPVAIPAYGSDEVADVTGAGDTVIATLTLALAAGATPLDAARLANYAAGLVVTKAGTATVAPAELLRAIEEDAAS